MKQNVRLLIFFFSLSFLPMMAMAQFSVIKGKVMDEKTADPLPYVNIGVRGQSSGTFSDSNGAFRLELPKGDYDLFISSVGYEKMEKHVHLDGNERKHSNPAFSRRPSHLSKEFFYLCSEDRLSSPIP